MSRKNRQNKAKLEHKLYIARETREPVFDLSECALQEVPQGIYSLCRVFLKDILRLDNNCLTSLSGGGELKDLMLLRTLDLHNNNFVSLPDSIDLLKNLQELYLNNNCLKKLPNTISNLSHLIVLNVENNLLKSLPEHIGYLKELKCLNIQNNPHLKLLPKSICKAPKLTKLEITSKYFLYPPSDVAEKGTEAILRYICDDVGVDYVGFDNVDSSFVEKDSNEGVDAVEAKIWNLENIKKTRLQNLMEMEKANQLLSRQEFELTNSQKINKHMLLEDITKRQKELDLDLLRIQQEKDMQRLHLIEHVLEGERKTDKAIQQLLVLNHEPVEQILAKEKDQEERLIAAVNKSSQTLRKDDTLLDMEKLLQQEIVTFQHFKEDRLEISKTILEQEMEHNSHLGEILKNQYFHKNQLLTTLQEESDLQKAAVAALLERGDARSWSLLQQVKLVEAQLVALTTFELERKKLKLDQNLNDSAEKRINLSCLLRDLLEQQNLRRAQLRSALEALENESDRSDDFWLKQYQHILNKSPAGLSEPQNMDLCLAQELLINGVANCLPFLASLLQSKCNIEEITEGDLKRAGIASSVDRLHILKAFEKYKTQRNYGNGPFVPSAPTFALEEASAPPFETVTAKSECIICMDRPCDIIYVPCGHFCCCSQCSTTLSQCPMCRTTIEHKIRVIQS